MGCSHALQHHNDMANANDMERQLDDVLLDAQRLGWDYSRTLAHYTTAIMEWLAGPPMHIGRGTAYIEELAKILMDPDEGLIRGGLGYKDLDLGAINRARIKLYKCYNKSIEKFTRRGLNIVEEVAEAES